MSWCLLRAWSPAVEGAKYIASLIKRVGRQVVEWAAGAARGSVLDDFKGTDGKSGR